MYLEFCWHIKLAQYNGTGLVQESVDTAHLQTLADLPQRPCITRRWTHAVLCLGWLNTF
jgi:hypothetical protein